MTTQESMYLFRFSDEILREVNPMGIYHMARAIESLVFDNPKKAGQEFREYLHTVIYPKAHTIPQVMDLNEAETKVFFGEIATLTKLSLEKGILPVASFMIGDSLYKQNRDLFMAWVLACKNLNEILLLSGDISISSKNGYLRFRAIGVVHLAPYRDFLCQLMRYGYGSMEWWFEGPNRALLSLGRWIGDGYSVTDEVPAEIMEKIHGRLLERDAKLIQAYRPGASLYKNSAIEHNFEWGNVSSLVD